MVVVVVVVHEFCDSAKRQVVSSHAAAWPRESAAKRSRYLRRTPASTRDSRGFGLRGFAITGFAMVLGFESLVL